jgi:hypothetical protein
MNLKTKLVTYLLLVAGSTMAQAQTYSVAAEFSETMTNGVDTFFNGTFDWNGSSVTNLQGTMNSSMYPVNNVNPNYKTSFPLMNLSYQLDGTHTSGNVVTSTVFLKNTTDVYRGGGYDGTTTAATGFIKYGGKFGSAMPVIPGETPNENALFTLAFDKTTMAGVVDSMAYGDCTKGGLMAGNLCMAGEITGTSAMAGTPLSLSITAVPIPAAVWLFGGALTGLIGISRRKRALAV